MQVTLTGSNLEVKTPVGFWWKQHPLVGRLFQNSLTNEFSTTLDVDGFEYSGAGRKYYVDPVNGNEANDGLSWATALKRLKTAATKADVDSVEVAAGTVYRNDLPATITRSMTIKAKAGADVVLSAHDSLAWTKTTGKNITYQAARSTVGAVYDSLYKDQNGDYKKLVSRATLDELDLNPGSWYTDGTTVYVSLSDSRAADANVRAYLNVNFLTAVNCTVCLKDLRMEGGRTVDITNSANESVYVKNCEFKYGVVSNGGLTIKGCDKIIVQNCLAALNENDGFNYHANGSVLPKVIEINCVGRDNGSADNNDNGSSIHDGGAIIRINGKYCGNLGPNAADVNDGTDSWNLGCIAYGSKGAAGSSNADFLVSTGSAEMWLDGCVGYGSENSLGVNDAASKAYVRNSKLSAIGSLTGKKYDY